MQLHCKSRMSDMSINRFLFQFKGFVLNKKRNECSSAFNHIWTTHDGHLYHRLGHVVIKYDLHGKIVYLLELLDEEKLLEMVNYALGPIQLI